MVARGSAARLRSADQGGAGNPRLGSAALQPRDGAAAADAPAQAGAARASCSSGATGAQVRRVRGCAVPGAQVRQVPVRSAPVHAVSDGRRRVRPSRRAPQPPPASHRAPAHLHRTARTCAPTHLRTRAPGCCRSERSLPRRGQSVEVDLLQPGRRVRRFASTSTPSRITFTFLPNQKSAEEQCDEQKALARRRSPRRSPAGQCR